MTNHESGENLLKDADIAENGAKEILKWIGDIKLKLDRKVR